MTSCETFFLNALNVFLNHTPEVEQKFYETDLSFSQWEELYQLASLHQVLPMIYDVVYRHPAYAKASEELKSQFRQISRTCMVVQVYRTEAFLTIYQKLLDAGLKVLALKGIICRNLYDKPDIRISADEDIFVQEHEFQKVHEIFRENGYTIEKGEDPRSDQIVNYIDPKTGLHVELHRHLFDHTNAEYRKLNELFSDAFERAISQEIQGVSVWTMCETDHLLYLFLHGFKHFLGHGFGIRQVSDMVLYARTYGDRIEWLELIERASHRRADIFAMNLLHIGILHLGVSFEQMHIPEQILRRYNHCLDSAPLLTDILETGIIESDLHGQSNCFSLSSFLTTKWAEKVQKYWKEHHRISLTGQENRIELFKIYGILE